MVLFLQVNPLQDRDGLCEQLYHFLWRKNANGHTCPGINLPDTVSGQGGDDGMGYWGIAMSAGPAILALSSWTSEGSPLHPPPSSPLVPFTLIFSSVRCF